MERETRPADSYSLTDLARLADVTPRTIRYYIAQGLIAAPTGSGQAARYGEGHLARLRLIRRLQREHLPLAEIRSRLGRLTDDELAALLGDDATTMAPPPPTDSAADYIRRVLAGVPAPAPVAAPAMLLRASAHVASEAAPPLATPATPPAATADAEPDRSTWERVALTPDVELHLRRPLDRQTNKRVDRLIRIARELLEED